MIAKQLSFFDVVETIDRNGNGHADPLADLIWDWREYRKSEADASSARYPAPCLCARPLVEHEHDGSVTCFRCGRAVRRLLDPERGALLELIALALATNGKPTANQRQTNNGEDA